MPIPPRALKRAPYPDSFSRALFAVSPYRGCGHGCRYCDGRSEKYYVEGDFEHDIQCRTDRPEALRRELSLVRERGIVAIGSGVTDAYQGVEERERLTRACLEAIAESDLSPLVMTKSSLVERDLDLWAAFAKERGATLVMSIASVDEGLRERMEPGASSFASRLATLAKFKAAGCSTGALAMPCLPWLSDGEDALAATFGALKKAGVDWVLPGSLTLRPGRQKELYLETLAPAHSGLLARYRELYGEDRPSGMPRREYLRAFGERAFRLLREAGLSPLMPHAAYAPMMEAQDSLRLLFRDMAEAYRARGVDVRRLAAAADRYDAWLKAERAGFRRKRSLPRGWLEARLAESIRSGELAGALGNGKLASFAARVVAGETFDFESLSLRPPSCPSS
jgi:DNA repair photolyase